MIFRGNGIKVQADLDGTNLVFSVLEQTTAATKFIRDAETVTYGEWGLRTANYPSKNMKDKKYATKKNFYVRGAERQYDNDTVVVKFSTSAECNNAYCALQSLVGKVGVASPASAVRQPVVVERNENDDVASNPRASTVAGSRAAHKAVLKLFDDAQDGGYLTEVHREITGIRANDAAWADSCCDGKSECGKDGKSCDGKSGKSGKDDGKSGDKDGKSVITKVRHAIYTASQAAILRLTGYKTWPTKRTWTKMNTVPSLGNVHIDEHLGIDQGVVGVLNKALS